MQAGSLIRSAGGQDAREKEDERIPGGSDMIETVLKRAEEKCGGRPASKAWDLISMRYCHGQPYIMGLMLRICAAEAGVKTS